MIMRGDDSKAPIIWYTQAPPPPDPLDESGSHPLCGSLRKAPASGGNLSNGASRGAGSRDRTHSPGSSATSAVPVSLGARSWVSSLRLRHTG